MKFRQPEPFKSSGGKLGAFSLGILFSAFGAITLAWAYYRFPGRTADSATWPRWVFFVFAALIAFLVAIWFISKARSLETVKEPEVGLTWWNVVFPGGLVGLCATLTWVSGSRGQWFVAVGWVAASILAAWATVAIIRRLHQQPRGLERGLGAQVAYVVVNLVYCIAFLQWLPSGYRWLGVGMMLVTAHFAAILEWRLRPPVPPDFTRYDVKGPGIP